MQARTGAEREVVEDDPLLLLEEEPALHRPKAKTSVAPTTASDAISDPIPSTMFLGPFARAEVLSQTRELNG